MLHQQALEGREQELALCLTVCFVVEDMKKGLDCRGVLGHMPFCFPQMMLGMAHSKDLYELNLQDIWEGRRLPLKGRKAGLWAGARSGCYCFATRCQWRPHC